MAESHLRALIEAGMLRATDYVWKDGMPEWAEVRAIPGLLPRSMVKPPSSVKPPPAPMPLSLNDESNEPEPRGRAARTREEEKDSDRQTQPCPFCATEIPVRAKVCRVCRETVDVALRAAEEAKREAKAARREGGSRDRLIIQHRDYRQFPHGLHLIMTILTMGMWLPIWLIHYVIWELT